LGFRHDNCLYECRINIVTVCGPHDNAMEQMLCLFNRQQIILGAGILNPAKEREGEYKGDHYHKK
jgi:hypothetical protein